jgi:DNA polymerase III epsilon subunit-like protein
MAHLITPSEDSARRARTPPRTRYHRARVSYFMVDVEADGPIPGRYSMVSFGAIVVEPGLQRTFYGQVRPISEQFVPEALAVCRLSREETLAFPEPGEVMRAFGQWIAGNTTGRPMFISDNNGFDWQFMNWYFHAFLRKNPFGHSSTNLGSLYKGLVKDVSKTFKPLRRTRHTHNPVDDARGNAEALLHLRDAMGLKIDLR